MSKVDGKHIIGKLLNPLDDKSLATLGPADYVFVLLVLNVASRTSKI